MMEFTSASWLNFISFTKNVLVVRHEVCLYTVYAIEEFAAYNLSLPI